MRATHYTTKPNINEYSENFTTEGEATGHFSQESLVLIRENRTWMEAVSFCRRHHVDLVSVHTAEVQGLVAEASRGASTPHVWLGLRFTCSLQVWFWISPEGGCFQNWAQGYGPTRTNGCGDTGAIETKGDHRWVSLPETEKLNFICSTCGSRKR
ncbi:snaclec agkicetin-C subunit beta-like [Megalops cyprinoides]|uniref:snaclec agkicetin-C subunit beta-like n=1 Tax=Megalops cyprinoides TaxID=118141 RepID=UPI00186530C1|nr:snaclec agkicetin-C subunit beta-like [Megalops cyprinoides]